jgi:hypothetical protein
MWHTRYAIKPSASAAPVQPAAKVEDAAPKVNIVFAAAGKKQADEAEPKDGDVSASTGKKQPSVPQTNETVPVVATNTTSPATNGTYQARRQVQPATPTLSEEIGTGLPKILVHPIRPQASGNAPHVEPNVVAARAAPKSYKVVSWDETTQA